jgi:hypothetical protein
MVTNQHFSVKLLDDTVQEVNANGGHQSGITEKNSIKCGIEGEVDV